MAEIMPSLPQFDVERFNKASPGFEPMFLRFRSACEPDRNLQRDS